MSLSAWWQGARYHFVSSSFLAVTAGSAMALGLEGRFDAVNYLLVLAAVVINHVALNLTDDYFDYKHAIDETDPAWRSAYSGGSGVLTGGLLSPQSVRRAFVLDLLSVAASRSHRRRRRTRVVRILDLVLRIFCSFPVELRRVVFLVEAIQVESRLTGFRRR